MDPSGSPEPVAPGLESVRLGFHRIGLVGWSVLASERVVGVGDLVDRGLWMLLRDSIYAACVSSPKPIQR